jgi:hypothetical protein
MNDKYCNSLIIKRLCKSKIAFPIFSGCIISHAECSESICILTKKQFFLALLHIKILLLNSE